jgi:hypothetical protein
MTHRLAIALLAGIALSACRHGEITAATPPMDAAGTWWLTMTLNVVRLADGYRAELECRGTVALTQEPGTGSVRGAVRYSYRCEGGSELRGTVNAAGKAAFTMDGFKPYEPADSPCPGAKGVSFSGELSTFADLGTRLYATGITRVSCGELGDHEFTYTFDGWRDG